MNNNKIHIACALTGTLFVLAFFLPVLIWGQGVHIMIHDSLDSVFLNAKVLAESEMLWAPSDVIVDIYNVPRLALGTQWNAIPYLFIIFGPFGGYIVNLLLIKLVAFIGFFLLINRLYLHEEEVSAIVLKYSIAASFAALPFFGMAGLSVAGLPLAVYALINFYQRTYRWTDWIIVATLPFYSSLFYSFLFLLIFAAGFFIWAIIKERRIPWPFFFSLTLMSALFILVEYRLFLNALDPVFAPQRSDYAKQGETFWGAWKEVKKNFFLSQYHVPTNHLDIILPFTLLYVALAPCRKNWNDFSFKIAAGCLMACLAISVFYGFWDSALFIGLREKISLLREFNLARFHWLHPLLWYAGFGAAAFGFHKTIPYKRLRYLPVALVLFQAGSNLILSEKSEFMNPKEPGSYREFTAPTQFESIAKTIGKDKEEYRVASIGIHPSIAAYNGFRTIDFYMGYYPLSHKQNLYLAMKDELARDPALEKYFLNWGNRAYLFTAKTGKQFLPRKGEFENDDGVPYAPRFDNEKLHEMGAHYLISRIKLEGYDLLGIFPAEEGESLVTLYLYEI